MKFCRWSLGLLAILATGGCKDPTRPAGQEDDLPDSGPFFRLAYVHDEGLGQASAPLSAFGSGRLDVAIASKSQVHLLRNVGNGSFQEAGSRSVDRANGWGLHDFNLDGRLDLFIAQQERTGSKDALLNNGNGSFSPADLGNETIAPTRTVIFADFDGDGHADSYHASSAFGENHAWNELHPGLAPGSFGEDIIDDILDPPNPSFWHAPASGPNGCEGEWSNKQFKGAVVRDFDRDGRPDLVNTAYADRGFQDDRCETYAKGWVDQQDRGIFVFRNVSTPGSIRFQDVSHEAVDSAYGSTSTHMNAYHALPIDFDRDGDFDLFVGAKVRPAGGGTSEDSPAVRFLENVSTPGRIRFEDITGIVGLAWLNQAPPEIRAERNLAAGAAMDYDNDGFSDLVLVNRDAQSLYPYLHVFRNTGAGTFEQVEPSDHGMDDGAGGRDLSYADLDGDGRLDVIVNDGTNGGYVGRDDSRIYLNNFETENHWIGLLVVDGGGFPVIGARLEVFESGTRQLLGMDEVRTDFSYRSKRNPQLHFGLGPSVTRVDVEILTRYGASHRIEALSVDQVHRIEVG